MDWQKIETAPKDGKRVLLSQHGAVFIGLYDTRNCMGWTLDKCTYVPHVTHWMPLPDPPSAKEVAGDPPKGAKE